MSTLDETTPVRGAQTVAPVQASALLHAASILGEASYTPEQELHGTLNASRPHESAPEPVVEPVVEAVVEPARVQPAAAPARVQPVAEPVAPVAEPVAEPVKKGFFARLIDKLLGR